MLDGKELTEQDFLVGIPNRTILVDELLLDCLKVAGIYFIASDIRFKHWVPFTEVILKQNSWWLDFTDFWNVTLGLFVTSGIAAFSYSTLIDNKAFSRWFRVEGVVDYLNVVSVWLLWLVNSLVIAILILIIVIQFFGWRVLLVDTNLFLLVVAHEPTCAPWCRFFQDRVLSLTALFLMLVVLSLLAALIDLVRLLNIAKAPVRVGWHWAKRLCGLMLGELIRYSQITSHLSIL